MKNINEDFEKAKNKSILFLGRFNSLNIDEIKLFLAQFDITYTDILLDDVVMTIESRIMSPLEDDISYTARKKGIHYYPGDKFERLYAKALNHDSVLMSLKLSNNQERLTRLLQNEYLDNSLFLKLFSMFDWGYDGLFDSDENMYIATLFSKRFYHKSSNDPAVFYSPVPIFEIALIHHDEQVLEVLSNLPDIEIKQSKSMGKRPTCIKEALATNAKVNHKTFTYLLRSNDENIDHFLASNPLLNAKLADTLYRRSDDNIKVELAKNVNLSDSIFDKLKNNKSVIQTLLLYQPIDMKRLQEIENLHPNIGINENLTQDVIQKLIELKDEEILSNLCANEFLNKDQLDQLYGLQNLKLYPSLAQNKNFDKLEELYDKKVQEIDKELASNASTPKDILIELFNRDDFEINKALAVNESLPIDNLKYLQLDSRLFGYLKKNEKFTKNILTTLGL